MKSSGTMDDKRTAWAIFLSLAIMIMYYQMVFEPTLAPVQNAPTSTSQQQEQLSNSPATTTTSQNIVTTAVVNNVTKPDSIPSASEIANAASTKINTGKSVIKITHLGGRLSSYELTDYKSKLREVDSLDLVSHVAGVPLPLGVVSTSFDDSRTNYTLATTNLAASSEEVYHVSANEPLRLSFTGTLANGLTITKTLTFTAGSYIIGVEVSLSSPPVDGASIWLEWPHHATAEQSSKLALTNITSLSADGTVTHVPIGEFKELSKDYGSNQWLAVADKYFMTAMIPEIKGSNSRIVYQGNVVAARIGGDQQHGSFLVYIGPKDYHLLRNVGYELYRSIDLGWFSFLAYPLLSLLRYFFSVLGNYGLAVMLLTLLVKTFMLPLSQASFKSMKAMQAVQPEMKALRERVTDPTLLNQEIMALYKRRGVNPLGGCFPALIQIPVFLGLYNALLNAIELRHAPFALWVSDLSAPEALMIGGIPIPVMVLLMGLSLYLQQLTTPSEGMDPSQRAVMRMMPIIFTAMFIIFPMPAGLVLYWLTNNIISIVQQVYLRKEGGVSSLQATLIAGVILFGFGYLLTKI